MKSSARFKAVFSGLVFLILNPLSSVGQEDVDSELYRTIQEKDSLLFTVGFNKCDVAVLEKQLSADFTFYHDQAGITESREAFVANVQNGLCNLPYKAIRMLDTSSVAVYPLRKDGVVYGAIQHGEHSFYAEEGDKAPYLTSTARFTHVWILEERIWKLRSVLSYGHKE